jgi:hypothetical protein
MNDDDFSLIRERMLALREGTGDMTLDEAAKWLDDEIQASVMRSLMECGAPDLENYGLLNDLGLRGAQTKMYWGYDTSYPEVIYFSRLPGETREEFEARRPSIMTGEDK